MFCVCVASPSQANVAAAAPALAAALGHHVEEHAAGRHGDVVRAGRDLDVVERVEVVVEARRANRRRIADVDAVQVARVLRAGRAARVERALQAARRAADVGTRDQQARHLVFDQRPDVAAAGRALQQLLAEVDAGVGGGRVDDRRGAGDRDRFGNRGDAQRQVERHRLADLHDDVFTDDRAEALQLDLHRIDAGLQRREAIDAAGVGDAGHGARDQHRAGQRDRDAGHRAALCIGHAHQDRTRLHLRGDGQRRNSHHDRWPQATLVLDSSP